MEDPFVPERELGLAVDLYELTMAAAYHARGMNPRATFELSIRRLPPQRSYLVAAGLETALAYLERWRFTDDEIDYLRRLPVFQGLDLSFLRSLRFTGDVDAIPEGTPVFEHEPLLRVTAPLIEAQIVETYLLSAITFQTTVATKASRIVRAARGRPALEFGFRRAHGPGAALLASRAAAIGGCASTSHVRAARLLGIPASGTMAHSYVMAHPSEEEAFRAFAEVFPGRAALLLDTYDPIQAARRAARIPGVAAVRLDSGDLAGLSREVRRILDEEGARGCKIVASGDLNEYKIDALLAGAAPIDAFGVGTELVTSSDAPALGGVYKLVEWETPEGHRIGCAKGSADKETYPLGKQVFRTSVEGQYRADTIGAAEERLEGQALLVPVMRKGKVLWKPSLEEIRRRTQQELSRLAPEVLRLRGAERYPVRFSETLKRAREEAIRRGMREGEEGKGRMLFP